MRATAGVLAALSVLMLAGCAQTGAGSAAVGPRQVQKPTVLGYRTGLMPGLHADAASRPVAAILGPGRVALATWGSSSCPNVPVRMKATGPDVLRVVLDDSTPKNTVCTLDLGPTAVRLGLDPAMTRDGALALVLRFRHERGEVRVVARPLSG